MKISVIDNLEAETEFLSHSESAIIAALIRQNTQDVNQGEYAPAELERLSAFATPENIQKVLKRGYLITLLSDEGDLVGCGIVVPRGMKLVIRTLQVKTNYCGKGYGSLLYRHCEKRIKQAGLKEIEVEVPKFPRSEAFYKKHGFVKTGNPTLGDLYFAMFKYL